MRSTDRITGKLVRVSELFTALILGALLMMLLPIPVPLHERVNAQQAPAWTGRPFYLTKNKVKGNQATTACATGYHMASLFEIYDVSVLQYDTSLGIVNGDSGSGPPSRATDQDDGFGWVRTGSLTTPAPNSLGGLSGVANCSAWHSGAPADHGSVIELNSVWHRFTPGDVIQGVWRDSAPASNPPGEPCNLPIRVWCVHN
jgi:hypothetical protein